jgi:uncharacterized membrane protein (DUF485 family)
MFHENVQSEDQGSPETSARLRHLSLTLLSIFTFLYAVFIVLCAFFYQNFANLGAWGIPAPVWYGLGLIFLAILIAGVYGRLTKNLT